MSETKPLGITDVVLRDSHQSLLATRMRMGEIDEPESYTEIIYDNMDFEVELEDRLFTVFSLQSGRTR